MNLTRIFGMQEVLDTRIIKEHGLEGQNLFYNTTLLYRLKLGNLQMKQDALSIGAIKDLVKRSYFNGVCRWISFYSFIRKWY